MIGTIARWGSKGYGFVKAPELSTEAWMHAKFLDDPDYQPRTGDTVEFTPEKLADGRFQARAVRLITSAPEAVPARASRRVDYATAPPADIAPALRRLAELCERTTDLADEDLAIMRRAAELLDSR